MILSSARSSLNLVGPSPWTDHRFPSSNERGPAPPSARKGQPKSFGGFPYADGFEVRQ
jgi:hypothetical protein